MLNSLAHVHPQSLTDTSNTGVAFKVMRPRLLSALALVAALLTGSLCVLPLAAQTRPTRRLQSTLPYEPPAASAVPAPEEVLGFRVGDDRKLASWSSIVDYFKRLDAASDRV